MSDYFTQAPLGELCDVLDKKRKPITKKDRKPGPYPYYGATGVLDHVDGYLFDEPLVLVGEDGAKWAAGEKTAYTISGKTWVNNHAHVLRPKREKILDSWLIYYLNASDITKFVTGLTVPKLNQAKLREIPVPTPSISEQKHIVAILDEAFAGIETAIANTEKNLSNAQDLFYSGLRLCFSQSSALPQCMDVPLTEELESQMASDLNNVTYSNTSKTRGRAATERVIEGELSLSVGMPSIQPRDGWRWSKLSDIARLESGHTPSRRHPEYWDGNIPWIGIKDAREHHGKTIKETLQHTNQLGIDNSAARILPSGTVCLSRTASVGYVVVTGTEMATSQDFVNWVCSPELDPHFLKYLLLAERRDFSRFSSGSVHQTIYFPEVKAFHICLPKVQVQKRIASFLDDLKEKAENLELIYNQKYTALTELKQSLLHKAFSGELTAKAEKEVEEAVA